MEKQEIQDRVIELKGALDQSAAVHNSLVGRGLELTELLEKLPDAKEILEARIKKIQDEQGQSILGHNALLGRMNECISMLEKFDKPLDSQVIDS